MSAFRRFHSCAGDAAGWVIEFVFPYLIAFGVALLLALPFIFMFSPKRSDFAAECRETCSASGMTMTGVEFGSKRQCKCEVAR